MPIVNQKDINQLINSDGLFLFIYEQYGPPPDWSRPQGFVSLSKIILEQQVSLASANAHFQKLDNYLPKFSPEEILKLTNLEMRNCHISRQKASYLRALSKGIIDGELDLAKLNNLTEQEVRRHLTKIKGIGNWTADIYLMFCLQSKDIFPDGDVAIVNTLKELKGTNTKEDGIFLAENWKPLRSLASFFIWHYYLRKRSRS